MRNKAIAGPSGRWRTFPSTKRVNADAHRPRELSAGQAYESAKRGDVRTDSNWPSMSRFRRRAWMALASCFAVNAETSVIASNGSALA